MRRSLSFLGTQVFCDISIKRSNDDEPRLRITAFELPVVHCRRLRTNNIPERLNREIKRRTRVATLFPKEAFLVRLGTAVLVETGEEWQTEKRYLSQTTPTTAS